ncbi:hypothetical protein MBLNU459_g3522t1 [Dothideomycetes sp. NU459]
MTEASHPPHPASVAEGLRLDHLKMSPTITASVVTSVNKSLTISVEIGTGFEWHNLEEGLCIIVSIQGKYQGSWFLQRQNTKGDIFDITQSAIYSDHGSIAPQALMFKLKTPKERCDSFCHGPRKRQHIKGSWVSFENEVLVSIERGFRSARPRGVKNGPKISQKQMDEKFPKLRFTPCDGTFFRPTQSKYGAPRLFIFARTNGTCHRAKCPEAVVSDIAAPNAASHNDAASKASLPSSAIPDATLPKDAIRIPAPHWSALSNAILPKAAPPKDAASNAATKRKHEESSVRKTLVKAEPQTSTYSKESVRSSDKLHTAHERKEIREAKKIKIAADDQRRNCVRECGKGSLGEGPQPSPSSVPSPTPLSAVTKPSFSLAPSQVAVPDMPVTGDGAGLQNTSAKQLIDLTDKSDALIKRDRLLGTIHAGPADQALLTLFQSRKNSLASSISSPKNGEVGAESEDEEDIKDQMRYIELKLKLRAKEKKKHAAKTDLCADPVN